MSCFVIEGYKINELNEKDCIKCYNEFWNQSRNKRKEGRYYLFYWKKFFEFKELYKFVKVMEEKHKELGYVGLKKK